MCRRGRKEERRNEESVAEKKKRAISPDIMMPAAVEPRQRGCKRGPYKKHIAVLKAV